MTKQEFLNRLETLLGTLPPDEREDALRYYAEYLDAAENEAATIEALGSPEAVAASILGNRGADEPKQPPKTHRGGKRLVRVVFWVLVALLLLRLLWIGLTMVFVANLPGEVPGSQGIVQEVQPIDGAAQVTYDPAEIRRLNIDLAVGDLRIEQGGGELVELTMEPADSVQAGVDFQSGELLLRNEAKKGNIQGQGPTLVLKLPDSLALDEIEIDLELGSVTAAQLNAPSVELEVEMGSIEVERLTAGERAELKVGMGSLTVDRLDAPFATLDCEMGELNATLAGTPADYTLRVECELGSLIYGEESYTCSERLTVGSGARTLNAECGAGALTLRFSAE